MTAGVAENNPNCAENTRHFHPDPHKQTARNGLVPSFRDPSANLSATVLSRLEASLKDMEQLKIR